MGHSTTPTFRIEYQANRGIFTNACWRREDGHASSVNLARHCARLNASMAPGGANEHLSGSLVLSARLVRQVDGSVVALWRADS